ncbi:uncharacterized protein [Struthio camelus]|uniref:uncharacterized protein n=1 Tax=Struthio camelus TaxID=8801 RepID=UPI003603E4D9
MPVVCLSPRAFAGCLQANACPQSPEGSAGHCCQAGPHALTACWGRQESRCVRELSIRLSIEVMDIGVGSVTRQMEKQVQGSLLLLFFQLHDQIRSVAQTRSPAASSHHGPGKVVRLAKRRATQGLLALAATTFAALCCSARFSGSPHSYCQAPEIEQPQHLTETAQIRRISECLLAGDSSRAEEYLSQRLLCLENAAHQAALEERGEAGEDLQQTTSVPPSS